MARVKASVRKATATVHQGGKAKFPIPDRAHAIAAECRKNQAKPPLTSAQKAAVDARAAKFGVGPKAKKK